MNSQIVNANKNVASFDFIENGKIITDAPKCYLSLLKAGSMRFSWNEKNQNRENSIQKIQNQKGKENSKRTSYRQCNYFSSGICIDTIVRKRHSACAFGCN
mgnify:CR=1 FL=1